MYVVDAYEDTTGPKEVQALRKNKRNYARVMRDVNRHTRQNYNSMIRMRHWRCIRNGYIWDNVRKVAIIPPEIEERKKQEQEERDRKKAEKAERAAARARGRGRSGRGRSGRSVESSPKTGAARGAPVARRSRPGVRRGSMLSPQPAKKLKLSTRLLDVSDLDAALHTEKGQYSRMTKKQLLGELAVRDLQLKDEVSDNSCTNLFHRRVTINRFMC